MILALTLPCGLLSCGAGSFTGREGGALVVLGAAFVVVVEEGALVFAFRSVCLGAGRISMRSVSPFFFLALA
jgi:hypothetical protein